MFYYLQRGGRGGEGVGVGTSCHGLHNRNSKVLIHLCRKLTQAKKQALLWIRIRDCGHRGIDQAEPGRNEK